MVLRKLGLASNMDCSVVYLKRELNSFLMKYISSIVSCTWQVLTTDAGGVTSKNTIPPSSVHWRDVSLHLTTFHCNFGYEFSFDPSVPTWTGICSLFSHCFKLFASAQGTESKSTHISWNDQLKRSDDFSQKTENVIQLKPPKIKMGQTIVTFNVVWHVKGYYSLMTTLI